MKRLTGVRKACQGRVPETTGDRVPDKQSYTAAGRIGSAQGCACLGTAQEAPRNPVGGRRGQPRQSHRLGPDVSAESRSVSGSLGFFIWGRAATTPPCLSLTGAGGRSPLLATRRPAGLLWSRAALDRPSGHHVHPVQWDRSSSPFAQFRRTRHAAEVGPSRGRIRAHGCCEGPSIRPPTFRPPARMNERMSSGTAMPHVYAYIDDVLTMWSCVEGFWNVVSMAMTGVHADHELRAWSHEGSDRRSFRRSDEFL
jgi:hypothetical protein